MLFRESLPGWLLAQAKQDCFRVRPDSGTIVKETRQGRIYDYHFFEGCQNSLITCIGRKLPRKCARLCLLAFTERIGVGPNLWEHYDRGKKVPPEVTVAVRETSCPPVLHPCHPCTIASVAGKPDTHSHSGNQGSRPCPQRGPAIRFRSSAHALVSRTGNDSVA